MSRVQVVKVKRKNSNAKYTQEEVKQIINTRWGKGKYILMSTYKNKRTKLHLYCTKHDLYFDKYLYQLQRNGTCPKCNKENFTEKRRVSQEEVEKRIGDDFELVTPLISERSEVTIRHKKCGHTFVRRGGFVLQRQLKCPYCEKVHKLAPEEYATLFKRRYGDEYTQVTDFTRSVENIKVRHNVCGREFETNSEYFLQKPNAQGPYCYKEQGGTSKYEVSIMHHLEDHNIPYEVEKKFSDCFYEQVLPFDFYIDNKVLIEVQGGQHYHFLDFYFDSMEDFKKYQKKDLIKENYAKSKHIPFLAIPYTLFEDGSIKDYLDKNLLLLLDI